MRQPVDFIRESNEIEGILREPRETEIREYHRFMALDAVTVDDLVHFVRIYEPGACLRDKKGLNVVIRTPRGDIMCPPGGKKILHDLALLLIDIQHKPITPFRVYADYEILHPFTDGNGRSGRMLWMWRMKYAPLGFLKHFHYQALENARAD